MKYRLNIMIHDWKGILLGAIISLLIITFAYSRIPPIKMVSTPKNPIVVYSGESFTLCRTVIYKRDAHMEMSKSIIKKKDTGEYLIINFPKVFFDREEGLQTICRSMVLPNQVEAGMWDLHTYLVAKTAPFWSLEFEAPIVKIFVAKKLK